MQPLPKGVTGFDSPEDGVSVKQFTTACHAAARQAAGRVLQVRSAYDIGTSNFHEALVIFEQGADTVRVLCNAHYPLVAFAIPASYEGENCLKFVDCESLANTLRSEFSILTSQDVSAKTTTELIVDLSKAEVDQLHYWKAQKIGDVIFNYWD